MTELNKVLQSAQRAGHFRSVIRIFAMKMDRSNPHSLESPWSLYRRIAETLGCSEDAEVFDVIAGTATCASDDSDRAFGVRYCVTPTTDFTEFFAGGKSFVLAMRKLADGSDFLPEYAKHNPLVHVWY